MKNALLFAAIISIIVVISCGGGGDRDGGWTDSNRISLSSGEGVHINLDNRFDSPTDSLFYDHDEPVSVILRTGGTDIVLTSLLIPGCGSTPDQRISYLANGGISDPVISQVLQLGEQPGFDAVLYTSGDSSVVERIWNRGSGELAVLQAKAMGKSPSVLLSEVAGLFRTATMSQPEAILRSVYLSDRMRSDIVEDVNANVAVPPLVTHSIDLVVNPAHRRIAVTDTLSVDFSPTQQDSSTRFVLPRGGSEWDFEPLIGSVAFSGDTAICIADSSRSFEGIFRGTWTGFISESSGMISSSGLQIRPSTSYQCGMWFYPGSDIPASYSFDISVPNIGYTVYAPMEEVDRVLSDSILTVSYVSPDGGIRGPLAWAAGGFLEAEIAGWRSRYIYHESDSLAVENIHIADEMVSVFWSTMGYTGARLDFIIVRSLDVPVFLCGPGCVFISSDVLASLEGYEYWADSIMSGIPVDETTLVFESSRAFLAGSIYLADNLRDALASWSVYRFASVGDPDVSMNLQECLRKHYLYTTESAGGIEYAIADPLVYQSHLRDAILLSKAPLVIEFLSREIPAFERAIPRALGNLRHSGDSFSRLFSAMGIGEVGEFEELYHQWFYNPGLPQLQVGWIDTLQTITLRIQQYQPGQDFPLGSVMDYVMVITDGDSVLVRLSPESVSGFYSGQLPVANRRILAIDIDPDRILPADVFYRHVHGTTDQL